MKKISINLRLFLLFALFVVFIITTVLTLNTVVLQTYYQNYKEKSLVKIYNSISNILQTSGDDSESIAYELERIEINQNVDIVVQNGQKYTIYSTSKDFSNGLYSTIHDYTKMVDNTYINNRLSKDTKYFTEIIHDNRIRADFVALFGTLPDNFGRILIRTPLESIKESVFVTNNFLLIVGIFSLIVSSIIAYIISKSFTKPISELNVIAKKMCEFDFSAQYPVTSTDEIGTLGQSINTLSKNLENKIQELSDANIELEKDIEEKSRLAEMRSQFVSDVSHELKTPIALIQGYAEGLVDGVASTDEDRKYYCEVILDEANKMSALTHDLLDLSNLEYGKNNLNIETFNIVDLISNVLKKNELIFREKEIKSSFNFPNNTITVKGDIFRIEQVLTNYINNAIKNIDDNKTIELSVQLRDNVARVNVFNSGKNIDKENLSRIWNKFYKVDVSRNRDSSGSGIGLSLVKAIMNQHKNAFGVENVSGGVIFWFELSIT